ncbi:MAG: NUDIX domain-containing protein [Saprospiraceae bacterium]|nr:NUDIX domain-containing protein [Saprospiraceae bacterium]
MRQEYTRPVFFALYHRIAEKLKKLNPPIRILKDNGEQDTVALGKSWSTGDATRNAASVIYHELKEQNAIKTTVNLNFGSVLYVKYRELIANPLKEKVVLQGEDYNRGLLKYIGFESLEAFIETCLPSDPLDANPVAPADLPYTYYIGSYYSFRSYQVNKFVLAIQYTNKPAQPMRCWQWGFHNKEAAPKEDMAPKEVNTVRFDGTAAVSGHHLYIHLHAPASETNGHPAMEMRLIGICDDLGGRDLPDQHAIPCALQTVSLNQYIISVEAILVKCTREEAEKIMSDSNLFFGHRFQVGALKENRELENNLLLYLMLQRRNFWVRFKQNPSDLESLEYRKTLVSRYTKRLAGEYRIWNFGLRRGVVVQSKLVISDKTPYQAHFYPYLEKEFAQNNPGLDKQLAVLVISNELRQDQLCFATFITRNLTLVNYAIFDINKLNDENWVEGMFITTGYDEKGIIGGYAVMCKIKPGEECEPKRMERQAAEQYAKEFGLTAMHEGLSKLWKRKLWKHKSNTTLQCYAVLTHPEKSDEILLINRDSGPFAGCFDLPGGPMQHGETPEECLARVVNEETGLQIGNCKLWSNESHTAEWIRPDKVIERLHLVGAIYKAESRPAEARKLRGKAAWVRYKDYDTDRFSPFALKMLPAFDE